MRLALALLLASATAHAGPKFEPKREPPLPPKVQEIAHALFEEAAAATAEGKADVAIRKYRELEKLSPHPSISFNLALVYESLDQLPEAIKAYDAYLAAAPAADAAKVAPHVEELRVSPGHVDAEVRTKYQTIGLWYVDGVLTARGSATFDVPPGHHKLDLVTEIGYEHVRQRITPGRGNRVSFSADARHDGNVILTSGPSDDWGWFYAIDGSDRNDAIGKDVHHSGRYTIPAGKHTIEVKDQVCDYETTFDVRPGELTYLYFDRTGFDGKALLHAMRRDSPFCGKLLMKRQVVHFDAKLPATPFRGKPSD